MKSQVSLGYGVAAIRQRIKKISSRSKRLTAQDSAVLRRVLLLQGQPCMLELEASGNLLRISGTNALTFQQYAGLTLSREVMVKFLKTECRGSFENFVSLISLIEGRLVLPITAPDIETKLTHAETVLQRLVRNVMNEETFDIRDQVLALKKELQLLRLKEKYQPRADKLLLEASQLLFWSKWKEALAQQRKNSQRLSQSELGYKQESLVAHKKRSKKLSTVRKEQAPISKAQPTSRQEQQRTEQRKASEKILDVDKRQLKLRRGFSSQCQLMVGGKEEQTRNQYKYNESVHQHESKPAGPNVQLNNESQIRTGFSAVKLPQLVQVPDSSSILYQALNLKGDQSAELAIQLVKLPTIKSKSKLVVLKGQQQEPNQFKNLDTPLDKYIKFGGGNLESPAEQSAKLNQGRSRQQRSQTNLATEPQPRAQGVQDHRQEGRNDRPRQQTIVVHRVSQIQKDYREKQRVQERSESTAKSQQYKAKAEMAEKAEKASTRDSFPSFAVGEPKFLLPPNLKEEDPLRREIYWLGDPATAAFRMLEVYKD